MGERTLMMRRPFISGTSDGRLIGIGVREIGLYRRLGIGECGKLDTFGVEMGWSRNARGSWSHALDSIR
jgi:hypothetical protein